MITLANRHKFRTLLDAITLSAAVDDRDAIVYLETGRPTEKVSRLSFLNAVRSHAAGLRQIGIGPQDLVVIAHTQNLESIYAFWGAMMVGAVPSMFPTLTEKLDPQIYMRSMAELVRISGVRAILTTGSFARELTGKVSCEVYSSEQLSRNIARGEANRFTPHEPDPEEIAFLQHSSGTTGLQKGVALSHLAVLNQLASYSEAIELNDDDVIVSWLPLYHDMGLIAGFLLPLFQGIPLVLMSPFDWVQHPAILFRAIHEHRGSLCWLPNFAYNHCARRIRRRDTSDLSAASMRMFINCSEPVYDESHRLFLERFKDQGVSEDMLTVSYAMAENTFAVTQTQPGRPAKLDIINREMIEEIRQAQPVNQDHSHSEVRVSCGPVIVGTEVKMVDDGGYTLPERAVGEIAIRSDCMLSEYYRRPDLEPFNDGWYLTGDMGYITGGEVFVVGRSKDLIINAGKNIYPQDIEAIVNEVPGVHAGRSVAFGVQDEREGTELVAVVAEVTADDPEERKLIAADIRKKVVMGSQVTVSYVKLVDAKWLVKTSSGKVARGANREKWLRDRAN